MINRPVPPGRPRGSQVRSTSQGQLQRSYDESSAGSSPFASSSTLPAVSEAFSSNGLGLQMDPTSSESPLTHEIPLEDVEDALRTLSRDDLVLALKRAKEQMDILDHKLEANVERIETLESSLSEYATQLEGFETEKAGLEFALSNREERIDDLMREQERVENEVYLKGQVTERLRKQLEESERARIDAERRYEEQTTTSDKERQYYVDMERLLQTQKAKASSTLERAQSANHELVRQNERLQNQLLHFQKGSSMLPVSSPLLASTKEETGAGNMTYRTTSVDNGEDDESTFDSSITPSTSISPQQRSLEAETSQNELESLRSELGTLQTSHSSLMATLQQLQAELRDVKSANVDLRTQNETFVDLLQEKTINGEFVTESAMLHRRYSTAELTSEASSDVGDETTTTETSEADDDDDDVPDVPRRKIKGRSVEQKRRQLMQKASQDMLSAPRNLASELEKSEPDDGAPESRRRDRIRERSDLGTNVEQLHKEIWELRDANQALTLYVTKILDRIIAREGYENVLAIDADQKRTLRGKPSSRFRDRPAVSPRTSPEAAQANSGGRTFLGLGRNPPPGDLRSPPTPTAGDSTISAAQAKAARRNTSIDWRSFLPSVGGGGGGNATASSPLTPSLPMSSPEKGRGDARRIRSSEEVEDKDDENVREQIRQTMLKQGIVLPENQLKPQKRISTLGTFFSRVIGTTDASSTARVQTDSSQANNSGEQKSSEARSAAGLESQTNDGRTSPLSRREMRQRALDTGGSSSGNLTDAPARRSLVEDFRARRSDNASNDTRSISSRASGRSGMTSEFNEVNLSPSASPSLGTLAPTAESNEAVTETGWKKAMRRVSLLGSSPVNPGMGPESLNK